MSKKVKPNLVSTFTNWLSSADFIRLDGGCMLDDWFVDAGADGEDPVLTINWESGGNDYEERFTRSAIEEGHFEGGRYIVVNDEGEKSTITAGKVVDHYPSDSSGDSCGEFTVTWSIELDADSPMAAAKEALAIMRDPGSDATCFNTEDSKGERFDVDILEETTKSVSKQPLNRVGVVIEGGLVQSIVATRPEELDVAIIDYDTDGSRSSDLTDVVQEDGSVADAYVSSYAAEEPTIDLNRLFDVEK